MKTVKTNVNYARRQVQRTRLGKMLTGKATKTKLVKTGKNVNVTKVKGKVSDLAFIQSLPDDQKSKAYETYRKYKTKDIIASTAPAAAGTTSSAITGMHTASKFTGSTSVGSNAGALSQNVNGGMATAENSRDDDDSDNPLAN